MSAASGVSIVAHGMVTSVGFNGRSSCTAMRAGVRIVTEANLWDARTGQYLLAGKVRLPQWWVGIGKLAELVSPAVGECLDAAPVAPQDVPIILCVSPRTMNASRDGADLLDEVHRRLDLPVHPLSGTIARDRIAAVIGLSHAAKLFREQRASWCIIAAVDSLLEQELVDHYLAHDRLITESNPNGFFVGEAGGAVLVTGDESAATNALRVRGVGVGREPAPVESEEPFRALGLIEAIGAALAAAGIKLDDLHYRITDLNGEHYKFKEMVLAMLRYERRPKQKLFDLWHPVEFIGDVGAAIGPIVLAVALDAGRKGYGIGPRVLCTFGNDDGERAAVVAEYVGQRTRP